MPYDQFIVQQLAADKLPNNPPENLAALGFITVGERFKNPNDQINDRIDAVSKGFLGLTVSCARCHDHKFDPIPTKDYYALHGIFASTIEPDEKPVIAEGSADKNGDYMQKLAVIESKNRSVYYGLVEDIQSDFYKKIDSYLLATRFGGKKGGGNAEDIKARTELLNKAGLDREALQLLGKSMRSDAAIYAPFHFLAEADGPDFATKAPGVLAQIASGRMPAPRSIRWSSPLSRTPKSSPLKMSRRSTKNFSPASMSRAKPLSRPAARRLLRPSPVSPRSNLSSSTRRST